MRERLSHSTVGMLAGRSWFVMRPQTLVRIDHRLAFPS
jgi:hypothetical protein